MTHKSLRLLLLILLNQPSLTPVVANAADDQTLRVLTYNIHHGAGIDGQIDLQRIASVIRGAQPDIVALQEVDQKVRRTRSVDQPARLAQLTDMQVTFASNINLQGGRYGNALLSNLPVLSSQQVPLPLIGRGEQRGALIAQLRFAGQPLPVIVTHFDHRPADQERVASAILTNQLVADWGDHPAILAGDLNDLRGSATLRTLAKQWSIAGRTPQPTIPVSRPTRQIDFVLIRPRERWKVIETMVLDDAQASDHRALLAVLRLQPVVPDDPVAMHDDVLAVPIDNGESFVANSAEQWQPRRRAIVRAMQSVMGWLPLNQQRAAPQWTVVDEVDCGSYTRQEISYQSQSSGATPAYLCIPKNLAPDQRAPAALCLHPTDNTVGHDVVVGLGGKPNRQYASELAERGYVTLAPSYPLLAEYQPDLAALGWDSGTLKAIWDNMRGIDLLQSLPYVDPDRIGAIGHSLGGHNAIYTAVFDDRIKAVVTSCGFDSYEDYYDGNPSVWQPGKGWAQRRYMPRMADYRGRLDEIPFDFDEMLAAIAPRPVLVVAPLGDSNFRHASVDRMTAEAAKVYKLHDQTDALVVVHPDCDHDFPPTMRYQAYDFFDAAFR